MVAAKQTPAVSVLGVLTSELSVRFFLAGSANLVAQAMLPLYLHYLRQHLRSARAEPLGVQTSHDQCHKVQTHLQGKNKELQTGSNYYLQIKKCFTNAHMRCPTCTLSCRSSSSLGWYTAYTARLTTLQPITQ